MGNSLRCCLACVLPCGALDLIRIVHLNGYVEEITRPVTAGDILQGYPNHVISKPCAEGVDVPRILILSPDSELKKGGIYFLVPDPSVNANKKSQVAAVNRKKSPTKTGSKIDRDVNVVDRLFSEQVVVVPEKKSKSSRRNRRSKEQVPDWMPHLESIRED